MLTDFREYKGERDGRGGSGGRDEELESSDGGRGRAQRCTD